MLVQLRFHGLRYRLGLATCMELRQVADTALNAAIYSPSMVDAALDAEECLREVGPAYEKALNELAVTLPGSVEECCWEVLHYYIKQIATTEITLRQGLQGIMEVYRGCDLFEQSKNYVGDSHDIHEFIGAYWYYDEIWERYVANTYKDLAGEEAIVALEVDVIKNCKAWLSRHTVEQQQFKM